jgi:hypothetical protein
LSGCGFGLRGSPKGDACADGALFLRLLLFLSERCSLFAIGASPTENSKPAGTPSTPHWSRFRSPLYFDIGVRANFETEATLESISWLCPRDSEIRR